MNLIHPANHKPNTNSFIDFLTIYKTHNSDELLAKANKQIVGQEKYRFAINN